MVHCTTTVNSRQVFAGSDLSLLKLVVFPSTLRAFGRQCALRWLALRQTSGLVVPTRADLGPERTAGLRDRLRLRLP